MIVVLTDRTMTPSSIVDSYSSGSLLGVTITKLETDSGFLTLGRPVPSQSQSSVLMCWLWRFGQDDLLGEGIESLG